jgi:cytoskeletal protein RodZ
MTDIGATLREARMRARIDVSEIEARTKIRAKYLRALENEEWDLLPGPTFVRSFLRTYAHALNLDGRALVEEYRLRCEPPTELEPQAVMASPRRRRMPSTPRVPGPSRGYVLAVGGICVLILLLIVGLLSGKPTTVKKTSSNRVHTGRAAPARAAGSSGAAGSRSYEPKRVALSFSPSAPVYVCLIAEGARKVIPGVIIAPPYTPVTYHATRFELTLGNNAVTMYLDGKALTVPASSQAIGYSITKSGRKTLAPGELPTCQ